MTKTWSPGPYVDGIGWHLGRGYASTFNVKTFGAVGDGATDDTKAIQAAVTAAEVAGGIVFLPIGTYGVSAPITITSRCMIQGSGPNDTLTSGQCMVKALATASPASFPAGSGLFAFSGTRCTMRDICFNGNGVATNEVSMTHSEGTVRHLFENVSFLNLSTGPALWNVGCEDCTFIKCTISGSEATPASLPVGCVMSCPGGLVTFVACDFFAPSICNAVTVAWFGGNCGGIISANAGGSQTRSISVYGAWVYDGGDPYTFCPVDCCYFSTTGIIAGGTLGTLDDANAAFTATDVGKDIVIFDAGTGSIVLSTTIATRVSGTEITLTVSASQAGTYAYYFPGGNTAGGSGMYLCNVTLVDCHIDCAVVQYAANGILPSANKLSYLGKCVVSRLSGNSVGASNPTYLLKAYSGTSNTTTVIDAVGYAQTDGSHLGIRTGGSATHSDDMRCVQAPGSNVVAQTVQATAPAVAATTVAVTNPYGVTMYVTPSGGAIAAISVNGVATGLTAGTFQVPSGGTITLTYTGNPTWTWAQYQT